MDKSIYTDGSYLLNNPTWHAEDSPWKANHIFKILKKNKLYPLSICEIGYGAGEILLQLYNIMPSNVEFSGFEISPQAYKLAQIKSKDRLNYYLKDLLEENEIIFDVVLAIDVIEHVEDIFNFLRKLHHKGEYIIFHIPLDISVNSVLRVSTIVSARKNTGHIHFFTKETAFALLNDTGYKIIDYYYTAGSLDFPGMTLRSKFAKIPRMILYKINKDLTARLFGGFSLIVLTK